MRQPRIAPGTFLDEAIRALRKLSLGRRSERTIKPAARAAAYPCSMLSSAPTRPRAASPPRFAGPNPARYSVRPARRNGAYVATASVDLGDQCPILRTHRPPGHSR
jgi:hypothetical protein